MWLVVLCGWWCCVVGGAVWLVVICGLWCLCDWLCYAMWEVKREKLNYGNSYYVPSDLESLMEFITYYFLFKIFFQT